MSNRISGTVASGAEVLLAAASDGSLQVSIVNGALPQLHVIVDEIIDGYDSYHNSNTQETTILKNSSGVLKQVCIGTSTASGVITLYDGMDDTGAVIAVLTSPAASPPQSLAFNVSFAIGLCMVTSGADQNVTVVYS